MIAGRAHAKTPDNARRRPGRHPGRHDSKEKERGRAPGKKKSEERRRRQEPASPKPRAPGSAELDTRQAEDRGRPPLRRHRRPHHLKSVAAGPFRRCSKRSRSSRRVKPSVAASSQAAEQAAPEESLFRPKFHRHQSAESGPFSRRRSRAGGVGSRGNLRTANY